MTPKREVERWYVWDHKCTAADFRPLELIIRNPEFFVSEAGANDFISLYGGKKIKAMIPFPGDETEALPSYKEMKGILGPADKK